MLEPIFAQENQKDIDLVIGPVDKKKIGSEEM